MLVTQDMEHPNTSQVVVAEQVVQHFLVVLTSVVLLVMVLNFQILVFLIICPTPIHIGLGYHLYLKDTMVVAVVEEIIHHTYLKECHQMLSMVVVVMEDLKMVKGMEVLD